MPADSDLMLMYRQSVLGPQDQTGWVLHLEAGSTRLGVQGQVVQDGRYGPTFDLSPELKKTLPSHYMPTCGLGWRSRRFPDPCR